jgi:hypothetical protein
MTGTQGNATGGKSRGGLSQKVLTRKIESQEKQRLPRGLMPWLFLFGKETPLAFRACLHWKLERSREHVQNDSRTHSCSARRIDRIGVGAVALRPRVLQ